jgi:hypothetical protein
MHGIKWIMFHGHLDNFQKPPLGGMSNTKPGDLGTLNAHSHWFTTFYHVWELAWIEIYWNSISFEGPVTYDFALHLRIHDHISWFWKCLGTAFGQFLFGSHNFMITVLGSCVKWPEVEKVQHVVWDLLVDYKSIKWWRMFERWSSERDLQRCSQWVWPNVVC